MEEKKYIGQVSENQIKEWKQKYGRVVSVIVDDSICYLRQPDRRTLSAASSVGQSDPIRFAEIMLENCWLAGDEDIKTNDSKFLGVTGTLDSLVQVSVATLKEL